MQLIEKECQRQMLLNNDAFHLSQSEIFDNYREAKTLPPLGWEWKDMTLENIPEDMPNRNRTFQLFEEVRDLEMQWGFLVNPGPGVHKCCARHG